MLTQTSIFHEIECDQEIKLWSKNLNSLDGDFLQWDMKFEALVKLKLNSYTFSRRFFFFKGPQIFYKACPNSVKVSGVMNLDWVVVGSRFTEEGETGGLYEVEFLKHGKVFTLYIETFEIFKQVEARLRETCIMNDFKDKFQITKIIDGGSSAKVFLSEEIDSGEVFAVKKFSKKRINKVKRLKTEIEIMKKLKNEKKIAKLYEVYESKKSVFLVLEHIPGGQIFDLHNPGEIKKISKIRKILKSILEALKVLDDRGIIHGDIKPHNILFKDKKSGEIKLIDFGLSSKKKAEFSSISGTPGFVAPEFFSIDPTEKIDPKSDIFSLGVIFHFLLFGKIVFEGKSMKEILEKNRNLEFTICEKREMIIDFKCEEAYDLMTKMLRVDQKDRNSAQEALKHNFFNQGSMEIINVEIEEDFSTEDEDEPCLKNLMYFGGVKNKCRFIGDLDGKFNSWKQFEN